MYNLSTTLLNNTNLNHLLDYTRKKKKQKSKLITQKYQLVITFKTKSIRINNLRYQKIYE